MTPFRPIALAVALVALGCSAPATIVHISTRANIHVAPYGPYGIVVQPDSENIPLNDAIRAQAVAACADVSAAQRPGGYPGLGPGFRYSYVDVSDTGVTIDIECQADGSLHRVRLIFVTES